MTDGWTLAKQARLDFADVIEGLSAEQLAGPTLCADWSPHDVLAHLVSFVDVGMPSFFFNIARNGFNFDKAAIGSAAKMAVRPTDDLVSTLRAKADQPSSMKSFPGELTAADVTVHSLDVRRGAGVDSQPPAETVRAALEFITTDNKGDLICGKGRIDGLRLEATDIGWSHGEGPTVSGPAESLLLGMCGRPVFDELEGDGVSTLEGRA